MSRVFVAGASGAIGLPLVRALVANGHEVTGMTRHEAAVGAIEAAGGRGAVCDVYDEEGLHAAVAEARAEVVVHQLTSLPHRLDPRRSDTYPATNRLRREGTANLIAAARAAGANRFVAQSIAFVYAPTGPRVVDEQAPVMTDVPGHFGEALEAVYELERLVLGDDAFDGLVLRYGFFYGPRTSYASDGYQADEVRKRRVPIVGGGDGVVSFVHIEDAAAATVAAVERGEPGIYNVCDDEPAAMREWVPVYAEALGAKRPLRVPGWLVRLVAGPTVLALATELRGASNEKAKAKLDWQPRYPSWRDGFSEALG